MVKKTIVFDFDGVIHSYTSGWQRENIIPDPPVSGIKEAIDNLRTDGYEVIVVSTRCRSGVGKGAILRYLEKYRIEVDDVMAEKPPAICYVDDRAICFDGDADNLIEKIRSFRSWIEKRESKETQKTVSISQ